MSLKFFFMALLYTSFMSSSFSKSRALASWADVEFDMFSDTSVIGVNLSIGTTDILAEGGQIMGENNVLEEAL